MPSLPHRDLLSESYDLLREQDLRLCCLDTSYNSVVHPKRGILTPKCAQVWQFYSYRRHMALQAQPNSAHYALAELARRKKDFLTLSQNVDGEPCFCIQGRVRLKLVQALVNEHSILHPKFASSMAHYSTSNAHPFIAITWSRILPIQ